MEVEVILLSNEVLSESPLFQNFQEITARILKVVVPAQHSNAIDIQLLSPKICGGQQPLQLVSSHMDHPRL